MNWLRRGDVSRFSKTKFLKSNPEILTEEKSWRTWKSIQNIVMDEELVHNIVMDEKLVQNVVMDEEFVKELCDGCQVCSEGCDGSVHIQNWWMEHFCNPVIENRWKNLLKRMNHGFC